MSKTQENEKYPSAAEIKEWKEKYKEIHQITVTGKGSEKKHLAIVRVPKLKDMEHAMTMSKKKGNDLQLLRTLFDNCILFCDEEIKNDDKLYMAAITQMGEIVEMADAEIKKL